LAYRGRGHTGLTYEHAQHGNKGYMGKFAEDVKLELFWLYWRLRKWTV